eukprot:COSAG01_NODE_58635_length_304_cov_158.234146_2_plen_76_part_01
MKLEGSLYKLNMTRAASRNSREASINFMFEGSLYKLEPRGASIMDWAARSLSVPGPPSPTGNSDGHNCSNIRGSPI